jgi:hypothetical protein
VVHIYAERTSPEARLLGEAKQRGTLLGGKYSNKDGTAHDRSHQVQIPNKVADAIRAKFPDFVIPPNDFKLGGVLKTPRIPCYFPC